MKSSLTNLFITFGLAISLTACNGIGTAKFDEAAIGTGNAVDTSLSFSGISSVDEKTDSTLKLHWSAYPDAVSYDVFNTASGRLSFVTTVLGQSSEQILLTGLTPATNYKFRVRMRNSQGKYDGNTNDILVSMNAAPDVPSAVSLQLPASSPSFLATPTIRVSGVKNGDTIKLFTNSGCTTQIASGVATGSTIDLITSTLAAGAYTFYANATNSVLTASACSPASVAYTRNTCPTGYISVVHNTAFGTTSDFCVAKYEMKNNSGAKSEAAGTPWVSIDQNASRTACSAIGAKFFLISNPEWMTIARDLERVDANWSSGIAGVGFLSRGHSDNDPANAIAASTDNDPYSGTNGNSATSGWEQKRTHALSNGEVIWDFAGNVWEWVDWQVTPANKAYAAATPIATDQGWIEFSELDTKITGADEMKPETWQSFFSTLSSSEGIGRYYGGTNSSGGAAVRSGSWSGGTYGSSAFTLLLHYSAGDTSTDFGFRCVYRP